jgi:chemotaxis protein methyltransferase CheR
MTAFPAQAAPGANPGPTLSERGLLRLSAAVDQRLGIQLGPSKRSLIEGRLARRTINLGLPTLDAYVELLCSPGQEEEWRHAESLLTTNETYFFREPWHFDVLETQALRRGPGKQFRVWSAASSSGEEIYTIAMVLEDLRRARRGPEWEILGTDVSPKVLQQAAAARYPMDRAKGIPPERLRRYCLKGTGEAEGQLMVCAELRERCEFGKVNLMQPLPKVGLFDAIFLRNVLIYFDVATKKRVVESLFAHLTPDGLLFTGLAESLHGVCSAQRMDGPGVYRPGAG